MSYTKPASRGQSLLLVLNAFLNVRGLPLADVLSEQQIQDAFEKEDALFGQEEDDVYTPALTLFGFLSQVMRTGKSGLRWRRRSRAWDFPSFVSAS